MRAIERRTGQLTVPRRRRRGRLRRAVLYAIIPLAAIAIVVWGWSGVREPPDFLGGSFDLNPPEAERLDEGQSTATMSVALTPTMSPVPSSSPSPAPLASPAGPPPPTPTAIYTPAPTASPIPSSPTPQPPSPTPSPSPAPTASPTTVTVTGCVEPPAAAAAGDRRTVVTTANSLNLRARPGLNCAVVAQLTAGVELQVRGRPVEADGLQWLQVQTETLTGWVAVDFVRETDSATGAS